MITHESELSGAPPPSAIAGTFNLDLILAERADALTPDPEENILGVRVSKMVMTSNNAFHQVFTLEADDVLRCPGSQPLHLPEGAKLSRATLQFDFADTPEPVSADFRSTHHAKVSSPKYAQRVISWLLKRRLALPGATLLSQLPLALAIALLSSTAVFPGDSADDDTDDDEKESLFAPV